MRVNPSAIAVAAILQSSFPVQATPVCPSGGILTWDINANVYTCTGSVMDYHWITIYLLTLLILLLSLFIIRLLSGHSISLHLGRITLQLQTTITFSIAPAPLAISNTSFSGTVGQPITGALGITGGTAPFTVAADPASLPPGVTLDAAGNVAGTPTAAGNFTTPLTITDSGA